MARAILSFRVMSQTGDFQPYQSVTVYNEDRVTLLTQPLYAAATGADTLTNPITTDDRGLAQAYCDTPQRAVVKVGTGLAAEYTVVDIEDNPADLTSAPFALTSLAAPANNTVLKSNGSVVSGGLIVNANVDAAAGISLSKLATVGANEVVLGNGAGTVVSALLVNANVSGTAAITVTKLAATPRAIVTRTAVQNIADNTVTVMTWDSEVEDNNVIHDNATNPSRLTCKTAGVYIATLWIWWATGTTGHRYSAIRLNGTPIAAARIPAVGSNYTEQQIVAPTTMAVNDFLDAAVYHNEGAPLDALAASRFTMTRVGT